MERYDFAIFAKTLKSYYPRETNLLPTKEVIELWFHQLEDLEYNVIMTFLGKWVAVNKWSPSIADIRQGCMSLTNGPVLDWSEAWERVLRTLGKYGRNRAVEALESLDEITRTAVKRLGYTELCNSENIAVDRANFRTIYEELQQREVGDRAIPPKVQAMITQLLDNRLMIEKGTDDD